MRDLSPDRPDATESPYTVDAGHYQLEMDFANFTRDKTAAQRQRPGKWAISTSNAGFLNNVELGLIYDNYLQCPHGRRITGNFHDTVRRGRFHLAIENQSRGAMTAGETAFALLPYVKFPTSTDGLGNNAVEGGMIFPLAVSLPMIST